MRLVFVNGKRRHKGAVIGEFISGINKGAQGVDLAPLADIMLERVEVLRDSASAQYGSDAIAGVLNFVLNDSPDIRQLRVQYGSTLEGDGQQMKLAWLSGHQLLDDGFVTVAVELKDTQPYQSRIASSPGCANDRVGVSARSRSCSRLGLPSSGR